MLPGLLNGGGEYIVGFGGCLLDVRGVVVVGKGVYRGEYSFSVESRCVVLSDPSLSSFPIPFPPFLSLIHI